MALTEELPVYRSIYRLLNQILDARDKFPKGYRYEFGTHLMMRCVECCELVRYANSDKENRASWLNEFLVKFDTLRLLLRVCQDRKLITIKQGADMITLVQEIERQVTLAYQEKDDNYFLYINRFSEYVQSIHLTNKEAA